MGLVIDSLIEEFPAPEPASRELTYERWKALERRWWTPWQDMDDDRVEPVLDD